MVAALVTLLGATPPLNPLVIRSDAQRTVVPDDCNVSLAPAPTPRVEVRQIPLPQQDTPPPPPPSASLRETLAGVQQAVASNDRAGFDREIARARALITDYPTGAERRAAEEVLAIYGDVERLWDAQYRSPFFARESPEFAIANRYRGWEEAVRRSILTDATGTRFYPAAESRDVVARAAAERLRQLGLTPATPAARTRETRASSQDTTARPRTTPAKPRETVRSTSRSTSGTARSTTARKPPAPSRATPRRTSARSDDAPVSARSTSTRSSETSTTAPRSTSAAKAVAPAPAAAPPAASPVVVVDGAPVTAPGSVALLPTEETGGTTTTDPFPDPAFTTDPPTAVTETSARDTPVTATDATATAGEGRSIVLPLVLILIGLGVLVVLFRMSS